MTEQDAIVRLKARIIWLRNGTPRRGKDRREQHELDAIHKTLNVVLAEIIAAIAGVEIA